MPKQGRGAEKKHREGKKRAEAEGGGRGRGSNLLAPRPLWSGNGLAYMILYILTAYERAGSHKCAVLACGMALRSTVLTERMALRYGATKHSTDIVYGARVAGAT
eukprot:485394-Rhodomonas_salina.2